MYNHFSIKFYLNFIPVAKNIISQLFEFQEQDQGNQEIKNFNLKRPVLPPWQNCRFKWAVGASVKARKKVNEGFWNMNLLLKKHYFIVKYVQRILVMQRTGWTTNKKSIPTTTAWEIWIERKLKFVTLFFSQY